SNYTDYANAIRGSDAFAQEELKTAREIIVPPTAKLDFLAACPSETYKGYRDIWMSFIEKSRQREGK
ncbi:MAG: hypothetical protein K2Q10_10995, partial [Rhodospirillales bacterium]|nr:hypothetical protein [Rhodospirillales bacterium]